MADATSQRQRALGRGLGLDLRLLIAAGAGWTCTASALGLRADAVIALAAAFATIAGLAVLCNATGRRWWRELELPIALSAAVCSLCLVALAGHQSVRRAGVIPALAAAGSTVRLDAVVVSDPRVIGARDPAHQLTVTRLRVVAVTAKGQRAPAASPVLAIGDQSWLAIKWHQRIRVTGKLKVSDPADDVVAVLSARRAPRVIAQPSPITRWIEALRGRMMAVTDGLPADARGLVPALVMGDTSRLPADLDDDMRATGMTHLNAVSGSNVTFVAGCIIWLTGWLRIPHRARLPLVLVGLGLFVMICRPQPSVIRAAVMGVVGLIGFTAARKRAGPPALGAAIVVLLVLDPWLARSYGFVLSSLATAGLLFFARPWGEALARHLPSRLKPIADAIAIPVAAQSVCGPVTVLLQSAVSIVGVPANMIAAPCVEPATLAGVLTLVVAPVLPAVARLVAWCAAVPALIIAWTARCAAHLPGGALPWPAGATGAVLLAALTLTLLLTGPWLMAMLRRHPAGSALGLCATTGLWWPVPHGPPAPSWVFTSCDVGQGDAGVIATAPGHAVLVDTGPADGHVDGCLGRLGIQVLDAIVLTHFHADHVGGLGAAVRGRVVRQLITTPILEGSEDAGAGDAKGEAPYVRQVAADAEIPMRSAAAGDRFAWGTAAAEVLWPARTIHTGSVQNNASVTLLVRVGGLTLLLTGDLERDGAAAVWRRMQGEGLSHVDVLKVAHHGSANQSPQLVLGVSAQLALVSVGAHNDYGHPAPATLRLLGSAGSVIHRTDREGALTVGMSDGQLWVAGSR